MLFHKALLTTKGLQSSSSSLELRKSAHATIYFFSALISAVYLHLNLHNAFFGLSVLCHGCFCCLCVGFLFSSLPLLFYFFFLPPFSQGNFSQLHEYMPCSSSNHLCFSLFMLHYFTKLLISLCLIDHMWSVFQIL